MRHYRFLALLLLLCLLLPTVFGCATKGESVSTTEPAGTGSVTTDPASSETETTVEETTVEETTAEATTAEVTTVLATEPEPPVFKQYSINDTKDYVKLIGRTRVYKGAILADWTASGMEFEYEGSGNLEFVIERDAAKDVTLIAEVDGTAKTVSVNQNGSNIYRVATNLPDGVHHVLIRRRTMVEDQAVGLLVQFKAIRLCGNFLPKPADNKYLIAFLGDSITCGQGLTNGDGLATFAVDFCAREKFDYDVCCISGIGVQYSSGKHKGAENTMTKFYPYLSCYRSSTLRYNPERKADLVIVNLNTNDNNFGATEAPYKENLKTLISEIRDAHGEKVKIVWIVGMMISKTASVNQWLNDVFNELGGENAGLYRLEVETNTNGLYSHPDASSHAAVSAALSQFIRTKHLLAVPARIPE